MVSIIDQIVDKKLAIIAAVVNCILPDFKEDTTCLLGQPYGEYLVEHPACSWFRHVSSWAQE